MCEKNNKAYLGLYLAWLTVTLSHDATKKIVVTCHMSQKIVVTLSHVTKKSLSHVTKIVVTLSHVTHLFLQNKKNANQSMKTNSHI